jgi:hypothetical protein
MAVLSSESIGLRGIFAGRPILTRINKLSFQRTIRLGSTQCEDNGEGEEEEEDQKKGFKRNSAAAIDHIR